MAKRKAAGLADVLRAAIAECGMSARALGEATDVKQQTISEFLRGNADIRLGTAQKLCDLFGLELVRKGARAGGK